LGVKLLLMKSTIFPIGQVGEPLARIRFDSLEEAVAQYVVRELDFWAGV